jgi:hypothetical protein
MVVLLALFACDQKAWFDKFVPKEDAEFAKSYLSLFQTHDFSAIEAKIDPTLKNAQLRENLEKIAALFPMEKPSKVEVIGSHTFTSPNETRVNLSFQYSFPGKWLLADIGLLKRGGNTLVMAVNVHPLKDSLENINRFTFEGKGLGNYIFLVFTVIVPLFIIFTLYLCIRTPIPKRKWLWILFVLVGFVQLTLNWTDGSINVKPIYFQFLGAGFWQASPYAPVSLSISFPIGAIIFLFNRRKWLSKQAEG